MNTEVHELPDDALVDLLNASTPALNDWEKGFAVSLRDSIKRYSSLTYRQRMTARKIVKKAQRPALPDAGDLTPLFSLFHTAREHLKYPKLTFDLPSGRVRVQLAGSRSRTPGTLMVTDGGPYPDNLFYGRVNLDGTYTPGGDAEPAIVEFLADFASAPAEKAREYGRLSGACCFCSRKLTDERSTAHGYGPVCAEKWSLPWGK